MRVLLINGNTTPAITESIARATQECALPETEVNALTPPIVLVTVEGYLDGQLSAALAIRVCTPLVNSLASLSGGLLWQRW